MTSSARKILIKHVDHASVVCSGFAAYFESAMCYSDVELIPKQTSEVLNRPDQCAHSSREVLSLSSPLLRTAFTDAMALTCCDSDCRSSPIALLLPDFHYLLKWLINALHICSALLREVLSDAMASACCDSDCQSSPIAILLPDFDSTTVTAFLSLLHRGFTYTSSPTTCVGVTQLMTELRMDVDVLSLEPVTTGGLESEKRWKTDQELTNSTFHTKRCTLQEVFAEADDRVVHYEIISQQSANIGEKYKGYHKRFDHALGSAEESMRHSEDAARVNCSSVKIGEETEMNDCESVCIGEETVANSPCGSQVAETENIVYGEYNLNSDKTAETSVKIRNLNNPNSVAIEQTGAKVCDLNSDSVIGETGITDLSLSIKIEEPDNAIDTPETVSTVVEEWLPKTNNVVGQESDVDLRRTDSTAMGQVRESADHSKSISSQQNQKRNQPMLLLWRKWKQQRRLNACKQSTRNLNLTCHICGVYCFSWKGFLAHMNVHSFCCDVCSLTFEHEHLLKEHHIVAHSDRICANKVTNAENHSIIPFTSPGGPKCLNHFHTNASSSQPIKTHTGEKLNACEKCAAEFVSASDLRMHIFDVHRVLVNARQPTLGLSMYNFRDADTDSESGGISEENDEGSDSDSAPKGQNASVCRRLKNFGRKTRAHLSKDKCHADSCDSGDSDWLPDQSFTASPHERGGLRSDTRLSNTTGTSDNPNQDDALTHSGSGSFNIQETENVSGSLRNIPVAPCETVLQSQSTAHSSALSDCSEVTSAIAGNKMNENVNLNSVSRQSQSSPSSISTVSSGVVRGTSAQVFGTKRFPGYRFLTRPMTCRVELLPPSSITSLPAL